MSRFGLAFKRQAGKQAKSVRVCFGSPLSSKVVDYGTTLLYFQPLTTCENKATAPLPILLQQYSA